MGCQRKLLLSFMVGGLMLFYGTTVATALTSPEIAKTALGSTVHLGIFDAQVKPLARGSGFFVAPNQIATNYHVIEAILNEGAIGGAKLVGKEDIYAIENVVVHSKNHDLAIVKVKGVKITGIDVPALSLGDSDTIQIGDKVYVAGNPEGLEGTFSDGIISAIRGNSTDKFFQMTAPISPGSSGGPVLNNRGEVIGISVGGMEHGQNLNFAIPVNYLKPMVKRPIAPPIMKHVPSSRVSVGDTIPLTLDLISSKAPRQVTIVYKTYDKDDNELEQHNQEMRLGNKQPASSTRIYRVDLPPQKRVGSIKYYIEVEYNNRVVFRYPRDQSCHYRIPIVDDKRPIISVLYPPEDASFTVNEQITFRAEVIDNSVVEEVHIYVLSPNDQSRKLSEEGSSDMYTMDISFSQVGTVKYYLTATDEAGNESISEPRQIDIRPPPPPRPVTLDKGIKLYEQAKYNEAIEALQLAIRELEDLEQQGEAYLYLGGAKRGSGASNDEVKEEFRRAIRLNPNQKLPVRVGNDHPIFVELLEEVRIELIGELIIVEHVPPSRVSVGETIPLTLKLNSPLGPQQVKIYYKIYDKDGNELPQNNQEMHARDRQTTSSTWSYKVELPPQKRIGLIKYYIEIGYENHVAFRYPRAQSRYYQISILDGKPPTISVLSPRDGERFTVGDQTTVRAQVIDNSVVEEVHIYFLAPNDRNQKLFVEGSSDVYATADISFSRAGSVEYYLTATDEAGNESQSESRHIDIRLEAPPVPTINLDDDNVEHDQSGEPTEGGTSEETDGPIIEEEDNSPPTISLLYPPEDTPFTVNEQITIRAKVRDDTAVKEVLVHFSSSNSQTMSEEGSSDIYAIDISFSQAGPVEFYLTATDEAGNKSKSESRQIKIEESVVDPPPRPPPIYQGIWASVAADNASISGSDGSYMFRLAYLREGKNHPTLGAQLDFSPDRTNASAMVQWGPALGESKVAFTLLGGIAAYEDSPRSTHTTPIFGGVVKFYPRDKIVIDATSSIKFRSDYDTTTLYHYEIGARFYITRELNLRIGYGKLYLGNRDLTTIQVGLGYTF